MLKQMENVISKVNKLPEDEQLRIAYFWEQELDSESDFDSKILNSVDKLSILAKAAIEEFEHGETVEKGFHEL